MSDKKKLAVFDIDGTLYRRSLMIDLVEHLMQLQRILPSYFVESQALRRQWEARESAYTSYIQALIVDWEQRALGGLAEIEVAAAASQILLQKHKQVYLFTRELLHVLQDSGYMCAAISGSPKQIVEVFGKNWGFDMVLGTELKVDRMGIFLRDQSEAVKYCLDKGRAFQLICEKLQPDLQDSVAIGDSIGDLPFLKQVEFPIAFNPEKALLQMMRQMGLPVIFERKNVILSLKTTPDDLKQDQSAFLFREITLDQILPSPVAAQLKERLLTIEKHST